MQSLAQAEHTRCMRMLPRSRLYVNSLHLSLLTIVQFLAVFISSRRNRSECDVWRVSNAKNHVRSPFRGLHQLKLRMPSPFKVFKILTKARPLPMRKSYISARRAGLGRFVGTNSTATAAQWRRPGPGSSLWPTRPTPGRWHASDQLDRRTLSSGAGGCSAAAGGPRRTSS